MLGIALLWSLYTIGYLGANITLDVARDLAQAWQIAQGNDWPLKGPLIGGSFHLGPFWYYLLAPVALTGSLTAMALWVGFLAGSQFLFAWLLGNAMGGRSLAWGLVVALAIPGWTSFELLVFSHTNLVTASLLAFLWVTLRLWQTGAARYVLLMALFGGLMLHAHPSLLGLLPVALIPLWRVLRTGWGGVRILPLAAVVFGLPMMPALLTLDWNPATVAGGDGWSGWPGPVEALGLSIALLQGILVTGPALVLELAGAASPAIGPGLRAGALLLVLLAVWGVFISRHPLWPWLAIAGGLLAWCLLFLVLLRPITPFYMSYAPAVLAAGLLGLGLGGLMARFPPFILAGVVLAVLMLWGQAHAVREISISGVLALPDTIMDIKQPTPVTWTPVIPGAEQLSAPAADRLGAFLCEGDDVDGLHGSLATSLDLAYGLPSVYRCGRSLAQLIAAAGRPKQPENAWVGLPAKAWAAMGARPEVDMGQWGLAPVTKVLRTGEMDWAVYRTADDYPPRAWVANGYQSREYAFSSGESDWIVVTSLRNIFADNEMAVLTVEGDPVLPTWRSHHTQVFRVQRGACLVVRLAGNDLDGIEVVGV